MNEFINDLKVGDRVAVKYREQLDWGYEINFYKYGTVERITPKRTKIIINGKEISNISSVYPITPDTDRANDLYEKRKRLSKYIYVMTVDQKTQLKVRSIKAEDLDKALECLSPVVEMLQANQ